jgi:hypothetical protein
MTRLGGRARRLESSRARAHHDDVLLPVGARHELRDLALPACSGIMQAERVLAFVDPRDAVGRTHARADPALIAALQLAYDVRVRDVRASHSHQVNAACGQCMPRCRQVGDSPCVKDGQRNGLAESGCRVEVVRHRSAERGDLVGELPVVERGSSDDADEVD